MAGHWTDYIRLSDSLGDYRSTVRQALNDIWATPEGQELIRRAFHNGRHFGQRIEITSGVQSSSGYNGTITLNFTEIARLRYDTAGGTRATSITETLVHELFHKTDTGEGPHFVFRRQLREQLRPLVHSEPPLTDLQLNRLTIAITRDMVSRVVEPGTDLRGLANLESWMFRDAMWEDNAQLFSDMAQYWNALSRDPERLSSLARRTGVSRLSLEPTDAAGVTHLFRQPVNAALAQRMSMEEMAVDFTDHFMLRHFGIPPREHYMNGRSVGTAVNLRALPSRRWFPDLDITVGGQGEAVREEAVEYRERSLGRLDVPQLPQPAETPQRRR